MRIALAILILVSALQAQDTPSSFLLRNLPEANGIEDVNAIANFRVHHDCSRDPARWQHFQGTIGLGNRKIVHEVWIKVDPCQPQGSVALFCPPATSANPDDMLQQEIDVQLFVRRDTESDRITPNCSLNRRVHPTLYEF